MKRYKFEITGTKGDTDKSVKEFEQKLADSKKFYEKHSKQMKTYKLSAFDPIKKYVQDSASAHGD